ncbi:MAG: hypothetical protein ACOY8P_03775 [Thermodesulfobacteriota bacterium]
MIVDQVILFEPYPFVVGQKIRVVSGPRRGDWEVIGLTERKVTLRCPVSGREFEWDRFCYLAGSKEHEEWPRRD